MTTLDEQITELAAQGLSPYEIEERLNIPHYTVHISHHQALMAGYAQEEKPKERTAEDRKRERKCEYSRKHYEKNKEHILAHQKKYYLAHREEVKQRVVEWVKKNRDKRNAYQRERYHKKKAEQKALQADSVEFRRKLLEQ